MTVFRHRAGTIIIVAALGVLVVTSLAARSRPSPLPTVSFGASPGADLSPTAASSEMATAQTHAPGTSVLGESVGPTPGLDAEPTRVVVATLGIDLPVIRPQRDEAYPLCDVAEFLPSYGLPGLPGVTYLYAHARSGMFLALLEASRTDDGAAMLGLEVQLYSSDRFRRRYTISEVHRRVRNLDVVNDLAGDALVLQTSETSRSSGTKLVVVARPVGTPTMAPERAARPVARPRACGR
jgi:hypothetical protein